MYEQMDMTEDGKVSMLEFSEIAFPGSTASEAGNIFRAMDFDHSGAPSVTFCHSRHHFGAGSITLQEFEHYIAYHKQHLGAIAAGLVGAEP